MLQVIYKIKMVVLSLFFLAAFSHATQMELDKAHSEVGFSVKHLMISNVKGKFTAYDGEVDFDIKNKTFNSLSAKIDASSVDTGIVKRDNHLRSADFFDADNYPDIKFVMKKYMANGDEGVMEGELTMRGVTKPIKLDVEINGTIKDFNGNTRVGFTFEGKINRKDFGLTWNKALEVGGVAVGDKVKLVIELQTIAK